jgi:DNA-binding response OmpR family regulator
MPALHRILVVEDEPLIAMMLEDFLAALGKKLVGPCDSVQSALATIIDDKPEAAILDINLSGGEKSWPVADALTAAGIPFLLSSGAEDVTAAYADRPCLTKPYTMETVERALEQL